MISRKSSARFYDRNTSELIYLWPGQLHPLERYPKPVQGFPSYTTSIFPSLVPFRWSCGVITPFFFFHLVLRFAIFNGRRGTCASLDLTKPVKRRFKQLLPLVESTSTSTSQNQQQAPPAQLLHQLPNHCPSAHWYPNS